MTMEMSMPTVKELLSKPASEITSFLGGIYEHSLWVAEELVAKPDAYASFETVTDLAALMKSIVDDTSKEKKMELKKMEHMKSEPFISLFPVYI
jgi:2-oxo-4-hydroxy-4-carboxy--5-ureidoimidazoline (OHCU) decarboxylase